LLFSAVISEQFSKNRVIISVVAAKIWYLKNVQFLLGHPVCRFNSFRSRIEGQTENTIVNIAVNNQ